MSRAEIPHEEFAAGDFTLCTFPGKCPSLDFDDRVGNLKQKEIPVRIVWGMSGAVFQRNQKCDDFPFFVGGGAELVLN